MPLRARDGVALILQYGLNGALDLTANWTLPYATTGAVDELRGIADGSGADLALLKRVTFFPELVQAQCSLVAAFGPATPTGSLLYTRALDWDVSGPINDYPVIAVYQPNDGTNSFTVVSWSGFAGAMTGVSTTEVAVGFSAWSTRTTLLGPCPATAPPSCSCSRTSCGSTTTRAPRWPASSRSRAP